MTTEAPKSDMNALVKLGLAVAGAGLAGYCAARNRERFSYQGRVVAITGGSRGLGFALARELIAERAEVALLARDAEELHAARERMATEGGRVRTYVCDVTDASSTAAAVTRIQADCGRLDVLINNAGIMLCAPVENHRAEDFQAAWATHVMGPLNTTQAVLPMMRRQGGGRILNISSIGGKVGVPHMAAYCASKYGLVGLSHCLAAELRRDGIYVTVACPGLMRTGSHRAVAFRGRHQDEYYWFATLAGMPFVSMQADRAAKRLLRACRDGRTEIVFPWHWNVASLGASVLPAAAVAANSLVNLLLPRPGEDNTPARRGADLSKDGPPSPITTKLQSAADQYQHTGG
jgi:NAD(P)-dependent dehydrogenase (short-subunit alcohol dehydrogenase family)